MGLHWTIPRTTDSPSNPVRLLFPARTGSATSAPATRSARARWTGVIVGVLFTRLQEIFNGASDAKTNKITVARTTFTQVGIRAPETRPRASQKGGATSSTRSNSTLRTYLQMLRRIA